MIKPLSDHVVVEKLEIEKKTASGIILTGKEAPEKSVGKVVAVGDSKFITDDNKAGFVKFEPQIKPGDTVLYAKYSGVEAEYDGKDYVILSQKDLVAIIEN